MRFRLVTAVLIVAAFLFAPGRVAVAQQRSDQSSLREFERSLAALSQDMTEEYLEILEDLSDVLGDYDDYLDDLVKEHPDHVFPALDRLQKGLHDGEYLGDPDKLLDGIDDLIDEIKDVESRHRAEFNTQYPKCCRLPRSLRKELVITSELIEDYKDQYGTAYLSEEQLKSYIEKTEEYLNKLEDVQDLEEILLKNQNLLRILEALKALKLEEYIPPDELRKIYVPVPEAPVIVMPPKAPKAPEPSKPPKIIIDLPEPGGGVFSIEKKGTGAQRQTQKSFAVTDRARTIMIENQTGQIIITGSESNQVTASHYMEVASSTHAKEKEFIDGTTLAVGDDSRNYFVKVDLPRLTDLKTDLISNLLVVEVPAGNAVDCRNSFGEVEVQQLRAGVSVDAENSKVTLADIEGQVRVENRMGPVTITAVRGDVGVANAYAPIQLVDCRGRLKLVNEYHRIELHGCEGGLEIDNTGQVEIGDHVGDIFIDNQHGAVEIEDVRGNLTVRNGYQPVTIAVVEGRVELENRYAEISAEEVSGRLSISNDHGSIFVENLDGPVDIYNQQGSTAVVLTPNFRGGSRITGIEGTIKIAFTVQPDLVLALSSENGAISSSLPIAVKTINRIKTAELVLGEGGDRLEVSATGASIIIQGR